MREFKKNIILIFVLLLFINISSLAAKDSGLLDLTIEVDVPLETYLPIVYYNGLQLASKAKVLDINNRPFDITEDGETGHFTIRIEGNEGSGKNLEVKIDGAYFTLSEVGKNRTQSDVFAYPVFVDEEILNYELKEFIIYSMNIPFGPHNDKNDVLEKQFKLVWKGNSQVPFGIYTCAIDVKYTVI